MGMKLDSSIYIYLSIIILLGIIAISLKTKSGIGIKVIFRVALGGILIYAVNLVGRHFNFTLPLNVVTAALTGLLHLPGVVLILIIKYIIYP